MKKIIITLLFLFNLVLMVGDLFAQGPRPDATIKQPPIKTEADSVATISIEPEVDQLADLADFDKQMAELKTQYETQQGAILASKRGYLLAIVRGGGKTKQKVDLTKIVHDQTAVTIDKGKILLKLRK